MNSNDVIIYTTIHIGWCWDISYEILRCPSYLIILGLAVLVKVSVEICGVKTIQREDCKKGGMLKSEESSYVTPAARPGSHSEDQTHHANILGKLEIFSRLKQR